jgi:prepilin-type processing-associated H-X9-DG protein
MKLKTITVQVDGKEVTVAALDDKGLPIYVHDDGKEFGHDAPAANARIAALNAESAERRTKLTEAEAKLKGFEGIEDAEAAKKALETLANIDAGKLLEAGKVEEIKKAARDAAEAQMADAAKKSQTRIAELEGQVTGLNATLDNEVIGGSFGRSKFIAEKSAIPADFVQARFGTAFKREEGKIVGYYPSGEKIFSRSKMGELADFDEAIELLIDQHPDKANILKGDGHSGGGADHGDKSKPGFGQPGKGNMGGSREERVAAIKSRIPANLGQA